MEEAGVEPDGFIYSTCIHGLCSNGNTDLAFQVPKNLRESNKPVVHVYAYTCVIKSFVKELKLHDAVDVLRDMKLVPDAADCYRVLIQEYCQKGDFVKALDICEEMESRLVIKTDHVLVRSMMHSLYGLGMLAEALLVFNHFMQQSRPRFFLDRSSFNIAIDAASKLGKMNVAMELVEEMKGRKFMPVVVIQAQGLEPTN